MVAVGPVERDRRTAVLYLRLSNARDESSTSIARQRADLTAEAHRRGLVVVDEEVDNGVSGRRDRANAGKALRMLRDGQADVLLVWKFDRWSRQGLASVARLVETLDANPNALFVALQDSMTSDQPTWRIIAGVLAEVARMESENTSVRISSFIRYAKEAGRFAGGTVPVGYRSVPHPSGVGRALQPDPLAVELLTDVARRLVGGESLNQQIRRLNASALRPPSAQEWSGKTLRGVFTGQSAIGRVTVSVPGVGGSGRYRDVLRDEEGKPRQVWEPAVPVELWHAANDELARRRATGARSAPQRNARAGRRLLSGLVVCAYCGRRMHVSRLRRVPCYVCPSRPGALVCTAPDGGTGGPTVAAQNLEAWVTWNFLRKLGDVPLPQPVVTVTPAPDLAEAEESLVAVTTRLASPTLDDEEVERLILQQGAIRRRIHDLTINPPPPVRVVQVPTGQTFGAVWEASGQNPQRRRELLAIAIKTVTVRRGHPNGRFDATRFEITWHPDLTAHAAAELSDPRLSRTVSGSPARPRRGSAPAPYALPPPVVAVGGLTRDPQLTYLATTLSQNRSLKSVQRRARVVELRGQGLRAPLIAAIVGASVEAVITELRAVDRPKRQPAPRRRRRTPLTPERARDRSETIGKSPWKEQAMPLPEITEPVTPHRRVLLRDLVRETIRNAIMDGTLLPGELLKDDELQNWLAVSRTPIREAINELERVGLIEMEPNRYTRVAGRPTHDEAVAALNTLGVLYLGAIRIALPKLPAANRSQLAGEIDGAVAFLDADQTDAFHDAIIAAFNHLTEQSENSAFIKLLQDTNDGLSYKAKVGLLFANADRTTLRTAATDYAAALRDGDTSSAANAANIIFGMPFDHR